MPRWLVRIPPAAVLAVAAFATLVLVTDDEAIGGTGIVLAVTAATAALLLLVEQEHAGVRLDIGLVGVAAFVVLGAAVLVAPRNSHDLWSYTMYGRIAGVHGASPWTVTPSAYPHDPYLHLVSRGWRHTTSIYGPGFEALAIAVTRIGNGAVATVRMLFSGSFALAAVAAGVVVYRHTRSAAATALVLLHPAVAVSGVAGGHNDVLVGLGLLVGVLAARDDRPVVAGIAVALASLVKLTGGIGLLAIAAWGLVTYGRRWTLVFAGTAVGGLLLGYAPFGTSGLSAFEQNRNSLSRASAWELPRLLTGLDRRHSAFSLGLPASDTRLLVALGAAVSIAVTIGIAWWLRRGDVEIGVAAALGGYLLFAPYVLPWYPGWVVPVLGLTPRSRVGRVLTIQGAVLVAIFELKLQHVGIDFMNVEYWLAVCVTVALGVAFLRAVVSDRRERTPPPAGVGSLAL